MEVVAAAAAAAAVAAGLARVSGRRWVALRAAGHRHRGIHGHGQKESVLARTLTSSGPHSYRSNYNLKFLNRDRVRP